MRQYPQTIRQLLSDALIIECGEHSFFDASLTIVFDGYLRKIGELNEIVLFTGFFDFLSHDSPLWHALSELEPR